MPQEARGVDTLKQEMFLPLEGLEQAPGSRRLRNIENSTRDCIFTKIVQQ